MRVLRWLGIVLALVVGALALVSVVARFSDGPIAIFAGGALESGAIAAPPADWSFATDIAEVEFQLVEPPRSRTVWIVEHQGNLYVPCGFTSIRLWKQWPYEALEDGRSVLRVEGSRYELQAVRVTDKSEFNAVLAKAAEKYGFGDPSGDDDPNEAEVWVFRLDPRA